ncbi:hypothetical protein H2199_001187 [Coniosporium tulheliwenetii]|uniref:Uncharacterized protein n=1 Tax=Coniosporium tulheliwenetii TaxID=3383036 RepID=A0ACC2ZL78_9PEZI|nr:hypothetical protein H2199_001187 [Cladosporium sp. JES 115]
MHLSPYPADDSSIDEDGGDMQTARESLPRVAPNLPPAQRSEDGSWLVVRPGPAGIDPENRESMDALYVPTLEEQERERHLAEKNADVHEWLVHSEGCSEADDPNGLANKVRMRRNAGRRRARSTNDAGARQSLSLNPALVVQTPVFPDARIPGPGVYLDEESGDDDEDYISSPEIDTPESPPTEVRVGSAVDEAFYSPTTPFSTQAAAFPGQLALDCSWGNTSRHTGPSAGSQQSFTANQAIMRFRQKVKDVESASLAATIGSRRRSESDIGSLFAAAGISVRVGDKAISQEKSKAVKDQDLARKGSERRGSFLDNFPFRRSSTNNILRRKKSDAAQHQPDDGPTDAAQGDTQTTAQPRKRKGSSSRPKSPRLDTDVNLISNDAAPTSTFSASTPGKALTQARNSLRKVRSRSDVGKMFGLKELMSQHGGPPMLTLPSPANNSGSTEVQQAPDTRTSAEDHDEDELSAQEAVTMNLAVRSDLIIPDYLGFKTHIQQLNPRLPEYMLERATQEQIRRYKRLLEAKVKHLNYVQRGNCSSEFCTALGGEGKEIPPRMNGRGSSGVPFSGFHVTAPGSGDEGAEDLGDGTVQPAQFPPGVPQPPVKRLPAEFECPLCFQVKKFYKPSDWTKHVHEDVQPFTCTFPNCAEPKSFKRKADWVRHENERHRQLESWICTIPDCGHKCYRKDNFVQHLVREHKVPEPRARTGRSSNAATRNMTVNLEDIVRRHGGDHVTGQTPEDVSEQVWAFVELCRHDATKKPKDEPCRFCSNKCNSWKKLTVHLAKHMEQVSLPVLPLVEQKHLQPDSVISPVDAQQQHRSQTTSPASAGLKNASPYIDRKGPTHHLETGVGPLDMGSHTSGTQYPAVSTVAAPVMHTYPPPQFANHGMLYPQNSYGYSGLSGTPGNFSGSSYPPVTSLAQSYGNTQSFVSGPSQPQQNRYPPHASSRFVPSVTPASAYGQQPMYASPTDATPFPNDSAMPMQFPHAGHPSSALNTSNQAVQTRNPYDHSEALPCSGSQYQQVPSYVYQQQLYPFHNR